jgi:predicted aldo/keto reductase-like oxidoreductase
MSLDSLAVAYKQSSKDGGNIQLSESIKDLFQQLDNPSAYNATRFAAQMRRVSLALSGENREPKMSAHP